MSTDRCLPARVHLDAGLNDVAHHRSAELIAFEPGARESAFDRYSPEVGRGIALGLPLKVPIACPKRMGEND